MYNQAGNVKQPRRPTHLSDHAEACLQALADHGMGKKISLGGALGLLHYLDYRPTHDVDAWWDASATAEDQRRVIRLLETTLESFGQVKTRARIAQHRPLARIADPQQRAEAEGVRAWFTEEFLNVLQ